LRVSVIFVLVFILAFGMLQLVTGAAAMAAAPGAMPNVGWNTQATGFLLGGDAKPNVGWHGNCSS